MEFRTLGEMQKYLGRMSVPTFHHHLAMYGRGGLGARDIPRRGSGILDGVLSKLTPVQALKTKTPEEIKVLFNSNDHFLNTFDPEVNHNLETNDIEQDEDGNEYILDDEGNKFFLTDFKIDEEGEHYINDTEGNKYTIEEAMELLKEENKNLLQSNKRITEVEKTVKEHLESIYEDFKKRFLHMEKGPGFLKEVKERIEKFISSDNSIHPLLKKAIYKKWDFLTDNQKFKILNGDYDENKIKEILNKNNIYEKKKLLVSEDKTLFPIFPHEEIEQERKAFELNLNESFKEVETEVIESYSSEINEIYDEINQSKNFNQEGKEYFNWSEKISNEKSRLGEEYGKIENNEAFENMTIGLPLNTPKGTELVDIQEIFNDPKFELLRSIIYTLDPKNFERITKGQNVKVNTYNANFKYKGEEETSKQDTYAPLDNVVEIRYKDERGNNKILKYAIENKLYSDIDVDEYTKDNDDVMKKVISIDFVDYDIEKEKILDLYEEGDITEKEYKKKIRTLEENKPNIESIEKKYYSEYNPKTLNIKKTKTPFNQKTIEYKEGSVSKESHIKYAKEAKAMKTTRTLKFNENGEIENIETQTGKTSSTADKYIGCKVLYFFGLSKGKMVGMNLSRLIKEGIVDRDNILMTNKLAKDYYNKGNLVATSNHIAFNINNFKQIEKVNYKKKK